jgi:hypothetical protein
MHPASCRIRLAATAQESGDPAAPAAYLEGRLDIIAGRYGAARIQLGRAVADGHPAVVHSAILTIAEMQLRTGDAKGAEESARRTLARSIALQAACHTPRTPVTRI